MSISICGFDCADCELKSNCGGCAETGGHPFGGGCIVADCSKKRGQDSCAACGGACPMKAQLAQEFNALGIEDMGKVTDLNPLIGSFINVDYTLPNGCKTKFWEDNRVYLGNQLPKDGSGRCYGIAADDKYLLVCEYGADGSDAEIVEYRRRK
ncbi:MAG: DUF3795 domain-containing protein [Oscillospiraceae bacterium]|nr:DUF3795 domain-containing protein [Oscillospiraceae bacterium]